MKKVTRPFRYVLNQIPYNYTVDVANRLKDILLVDSVPEELWTEVHKTVQEVVTERKEMQERKAIACKGFTNV